MDGFAPRIALLLWLAGAAVTPATAEAPDQGADLTARQDQARAAIKHLQLSLQLALGYAMLEAGPEGAIQTCNLSALPMTDEISGAMGAEIGRTALRLRNPANAPDEWEQEQLRVFEARLAAGEPAAALEAVRQDETGIRFMKAIPMQDQCAVCHGTEVDPALQERITKLYPADEATGFRTGDLRGAFTVTIPRP
ncbi:Tll0287-like domain-containing protein [Cereibacter sediminicola]|uniref:Tll0287-like domain-containing protein n=1 Tax=Cereibacter sediminicola TaxID=2584941 RepID=UPI00119E246E|nr:DUF3365 domain-containing protein [Cereibacter sediminicola]